MIWLVFALGVAVIVLFAFSVLVHSTIADLHANQKVMFDIASGLRRDCEALKAQLDELQERLDYGRRAAPLAMALALSLVLPELRPPLDPGNYGLVPRAGEPAETMLAGSED